MLTKPRTDWDPVSLGMVPVTNTGFDSLLKGALGSAYGVPIDDVYWEFNNGVLSGDFSSGTRFFEFQIAKTGIQYRPILGNTGFDVPEPDPYRADDTSPAIKKRGSSRGKRKVCTAKSYSCGNSCISLQKICRIEPGAAESGERLLKMRDMAEMLDAGKPDPRKGTFKPKAGELRASVMGIEARKKALAERPTPELVRQQLGNLITAEHPTARNVAAFLAAGEARTAVIAKRLNLPERVVRMRRGALEKALGLSGSRFINAMGTLYSRGDAMKVQTNDAYSAGFDLMASRLDAKGEGVACGKSWIPRTKKCSPEKAKTTSQSSLAKTKENAKNRQKLRQEINQSKGKKPTTIPGSAPDPKAQRKAEVEEAKQLFSKQLDEFMGNERRNQLGFNYGDGKLFAVVAKTPNSLDIQNIMLDPDYQGMGFGSFLINRVHDKNEIGVTRVTEVVNPELANSLRKNGWTQVKEQDSPHPTFVKDKTDDWKPGGLFTKEQRETLARRQRERIAAAEDYAKRKKLGLVDPNDPNVKRQKQIIDILSIKPLTKEAREEIPLDFRRATHSQFKSNNSGLWHEEEFKRYEKVLQRSKAAGVGIIPYIESKNRKQKMLYGGNVGNSTFPGVDNAPERYADYIKERERRRKLKAEQEARRKKKREGRSDEYDAGYATMFQRIRGA